MLKIALIKEGKIPPDYRVPLIPEQCKEILQQYPLNVVVEPSQTRCYKSHEYESAGIVLQEDLSDCDVLLGVKEVPLDMLIPEKTYFFFSHTIKFQAYNRKLLQTILQKRIRLIDYEVITGEKGKRVIAFGKFAGMVGAHNGVLSYGRRTGAYQLKRMRDMKDYEEAKAAYQKLQLPPMKIILTGHGRVGSGAKQVLQDMGIRELSPQQFLHQSFQEAVFTHLHWSDYLARLDGQKISKEHYYAHPYEYISHFEPYAEVADLMINGIFWDNRAPAFFTRDQMTQPWFNIQVIADVTCDIAPLASIPSTIKASTIEDPIFGYNPQTGKEEAPHQDHVVDMMTIDNLPNELPRDASTAFGQQFIKHVLPELLQPHSEMLERATITRDGKLTEPFQYLQRWVEE